jgi:hypothetical protein
MGVSIQILHGDVFVQYKYNKQKFIIDTGFNAKRDKDFSSNVTEIWQQVIDAMCNVENVGLEPSASRVRLEYESIYGHDDSSHFWGSFEKYIDSQENYLQKKRAMDCRLAIKAFSLYSEWNFDIEHWFESYFDMFVQFLLIQRNMEEADVELMVSDLKQYLQHLYPDKDLTWMSYRSMMPVGSETISLSGGELRQLMNVELSGEMDKVRDLFVLLSLLGLRFHESQMNDIEVTEEHKKRFLSSQFVNIDSLNLVYAQNILANWGGIPVQIDENDFQLLLRELFQELGFRRPVTVFEKNNGELIPVIYPLHLVVSAATARSTFLTQSLIRKKSVSEVMKMYGIADYRLMLPYIRQVRREIAQN